MMDGTRRLLITDLDNTLWDWFTAWFDSFSALLDGLVTATGADRSALEQQIKAVHQRRGTTEYSNLVREVPLLVDYAAPRDAFEVFDAALHAQSSARKASTRLYPGVEKALMLLKDHGVRVVGYTESGAYWTEWRMRHTHLDGVVDVLYSSPDHDLAAGVEVSHLRTGHYSDSEYGLRTTKHRHVPFGVLKPSADVLRAILSEERCEPDEAVYVGDSLLKDIAMAQSADVLDVHARYGLVQQLAEYELLRRVTHWSDRDVEREKALAQPDSDIIPTLVCHEQFGEVLPLFGLSPIPVA